MLSGIKKQIGFTLVELLIAIALIGILLSLALPAFNNTVANASLTSNVNLLVGAINLARSEAVERNASITFSVSGDGSQWQITEGANLIQTYSPDQKRMSYDGNGFTSMVILPTGFRQLPASAVQLDFCNEEINSGRRVTISVSGSPSVSTLGGC